MKNTLEFTIGAQLTRYANLKKQVSEIQTKLDNLRKSLDQIQVAEAKIVHTIAIEGQKFPRRDGKPETSEETATKINFNEQLAAAKLKLIRDNYPQFYKDFEEVLPAVLRDENLISQGPTE